MADIPPIRIVHWTKVFSADFHEGTDLKVTCPKPSDLSIKPPNGDSSWCTITGNRDEIVNVPESSTAAAVVFHASDYSNKDIPLRIKGQPWILYTMESPMDPAFRRDDTMMRQMFDYLGSYNLNSRFVFPYYSPRVMIPMDKPIVPNELIHAKTGDAPILWIASNCKAWSGRQYYVKELMKYIKVDNYGGCLKNKEFPDDVTRSDLMKQYKFYLAIENANCDDYVSEKLFDTISASTVPIIDGPKHYEAFIPTSRSAIRMDAYPDPRELADYINYLDQNDTAYLEYFSHRINIDQKPLKERLDPAFHGNWSSWELNDRRTGWCGVCHGVAQWWRARHDPNSYSIPSDQEEYVRTDLSCQTPGKWDYVRQGPPYIPHWKPTMPDEFTRPWIKKRLPIYKTSTTMNDNNNEHNGLSARSMWSAYLVLYLVFFSFIAVLMYKRRHSKNSSNNNGYSSVRQQAEQQE